MKHSDSSFLTQKKLASSLKDLMKKKPLSKITVSELCSACGVNRKTFYYHFENIYSLLDWMLNQETVEIVKSFDLLTDNEAIIDFVIDYVDQNSHILNCAYDAMGREGMKNFFSTGFSEVILNLIGCLEETMQLSLSPSYKQFLCSFYTNALAGLLIDWFHDKAVCTKQNIIDYIILVLRASLPASMKASCRPE